MIAVPPSPPSVVRSLVAPAATPGLSPEAGRLEALVREAFNHEIASVAIRGRFLEAVADLEMAWREAVEAGGENQSAARPDPASRSAALEFLEQMPSNWPMPAISVDADGEIALDWDFGWRQGLALSIGPAGRLHYAWIQGGRTVRGSDWLGGDGIPGALATVFFSQRG